MHVPKIKWLKSVEGWVQLNRNEVSCGNLEKVGGGGIIRNAQGKFLESNWDHNKCGCNWGGQKTVEPDPPDQSGRPARIYTDGYGYGYFKYPDNGFWNFGLVDTRPPENI